MMDERFSCHEYIVKFSYTYIPSDYERHSCHVSIK